MHCRTIQLIFSKSFVGPTGSFRVKTKYTAEHLRLRSPEGRTPGAQARDACTAVLVGDRENFRSITNARILSNE